MIALIFAAVIAVIALACVVFGLAMLAGVGKGVYDQIRYVWRKGRGKPVGRAPWDPELVPAANRVPVPFEVRAAVWARDGGRCVYCGATEDLTIDHVIPRAHGGSNEAANLVTACRPCNSSKGVGDAPHAGQNALAARVVWRTFEDARRASNGHGKH